jgi:uncharacterized protein YqeY
MNPMKGYWTVKYRNQMKVDLMQAMKNRDRATMMTLRSLLAAIDNAEAVEVNEPLTPIFGRTNDVPRKLLTEEDVCQILHREAEARRSALADYVRLGREDVAEQLRGEVALIARYTGAAS